jgi:hypothetical protein
LIDEWIRAGQNEKKVDERFKREGAKGESGKKTARKMKSIVWGNPESTDF